MAYGSFALIYRATRWNFNTFVVKQRDVSSKLFDLNLCVYALSVSLLCFWIKVATETKGQLTRTAANAGFDV